MVYSFMILIAIDDGFLRPTSNLEGPTLKNKKAFPKLMFLLHSIPTMTKHVVPRIMKTRFGIGFVHFTQVDLVVEESPGWLSQLFRC